MLSKLSCWLVLPTMLNLVMTLVTPRFFFKPLTLTALTIAMSVMAYIAMSNDVLEEGG